MIKAKEIIRKFKEKDAIWEKVSWEDCLYYTEGSGFWKKGSVEKELKKGNIIFTPFAEYKIQDD